MLAKSECLNAYARIYSINRVVLLNSCASERIQESREGRAGDRATEGRWEKDETAFVGQQLP